MKPVESNYPQPQMRDYTVTGKKSINQEERIMQKAPAQHQPFRLAGVLLRWTRG